MAPDPRMGSVNANGSAEGEPTVQILDNLFGAHAKNLERALDRTSQRHGLVTNNLANVNVPGYKRRDVDFAVALEGAEAAPGSRIAALRSQLSGSSIGGGSVRIDGNSVDLESEVMAIAETELRYETLSEMTNRYFSGLKNVIREGR